MNTLRKKRSKIKKEKENQNKKKNQLIYILCVIKTNSQISIIRKTLFILLTILRNVEKEEFDMLNSFHLYVVASC